MTIDYGPIKVTPTTALHSTLNISETVRDRGLIGSKGPPIGNGIRAIKWSFWPMTSRGPKGAVRQYSRLS